MCFWNNALLSNRDVSRSQNSPGNGNLGYLTWKVFVWTWNEKKVAHGWPWQNHFHLWLSDEKWSWIFFRPRSYCNELFEWEGRIQTLDVGWGSLLLTVLEKNENNNLIVQSSQYNAQWEKWKSLSSIQLFVTPWTVAHQVPLMEFSRQGYWSGLPFPPLEDWTWVSCIAGRFFIIWATREAWKDLLLFATKGSVAENQQQSLILWHVKLQYRTMILNEGEGILAGEEWMWALRPYNSTGALVFPAMMEFSRPFILWRILRKPITRLL